MKMILYNIYWIFNGTHMQRLACTWDDMLYVSDNVKSQGGTVLGISTC